MIKKKRELWDVKIFPSENVLNDPNYYIECISKIFNYDPVISFNILKETFEFGEGLAITTRSKKEAINTRDKLILFGMKSQTHIS